jgi:hypothetical protein
VEVPPAWELGVVVQLMSSREWGIPMKRGGCAGDDQGASRDPAMRRREACEDGFGDSEFIKAPIKIIIVLIITSIITL